MLSKGHPAAPQPAPALLSPPLPTSSSSFLRHCYDMGYMKNVLSAEELLSVNHPDSWDRFVLLLCEDSGCLGIVVIYLRKHSCSSGRDHGKGCKSSPLHPNPACQLLAEVRPLRSPCHALCRGEVVTQAREEKAHLET